MKLEVIQPQIPVVRNIVAYYYILQSHSQHKCNYTTFPTINPHLMFFKGVKTVYDDVTQQVFFPKEIGYHYDLVTGLDKPVGVNLQGNITEVCVAFKPLVLTLFLENEVPLHQSGSEGLKPQFREEFQRLQQHIFSATNNYQLTQILDNYFAHYAQQVVHQKLYQAIQLIQQQHMYQVNSLARQLQLSERQLNRLFRSNIGCSPKLFIQIARFRQATFTKLAQHQLSLTELAHHYHYFDQSHFIRDYQRMTGNSPKKFYKNISPLNSKILWRFDS